MFAFVRQRAERMRHGNSARLCDSDPTEDGSYQQQDKVQPAFCLCCLSSHEKPVLIISWAPQDLHRTGCSSYCGQEGEQDRVVLKRVLLAYARWNKAVGYCQGFNVLAALILEVTEGNESDALKVTGKTLKM